METVLSQERFNIGKILLSIVFLTICSKIKVPLYPVPVTLQTFAVYLLGSLLSPRESFFAVSTWISLGVLGLPVFSSPFGGIFPPTIGYLGGMLCAAPLIGILINKNISPITACFSACFIIHLFGCLGLSFIGIKNVFMIGILPFIVPDILKIMIVCGIVRRKNIEINKLL
jgi:biotin transport system substrate-specific component